MLTAWITTGKFSGKAALQMAAQVSLALALQAGVKAIFEVAEGWAALAIHDYVGAHNHFTAAAIFGQVAAVAAAVGVTTGLLGRESGGAGGAGSAAGTNSNGRAAATVTRDREAEGKPYSSYGDKARVIEEGRNAPAGPAVTVTLRIKDDSTWLGKMLQADADGNGKSRAIIRRVAAEG
jgi:hypothetical protein